MEHTVALVDDHEMVRVGLKGIINDLSGYSVSINARHGAHLIECIGEKGLPDIAIVDLRMPVMDGYETIAWLTANAPSVRPIALSIEATNDAIMQVVSAGARGFFEKDITSADLQIALDSVMDTGYCDTAFMTHGSAIIGACNTPAERESQRIRESLTPRELVFLQLVCSEHAPSYKQIALVMNIKPRSVENFRNDLFLKFNVKSKAGLILFATRYGLLDH